MALEYTRFDRISLQNHPELDEKWVQARIADDPSILGLGDLILRDKERRQPKAGRLDLLLQEQDGSRRFEVEVQLGTVNESHIIRTIEYWDVERKRYPQYDHTAVIIAEDITSRFLNVISLFNGFIPLVAIQISAIKLNNHVSLLFTTVLDQMVLGSEEEDEVQEVTDRGYWDKRATPKTLQLVDKMFELLNELDPDIRAKYNKYYIGLEKRGQVNNFVEFKPRKKGVKIELRVKRSDELEAFMDEAGLDVAGYNRWGKYEVRLTEEDIRDQGDVIRRLFTEAYQNSL